MKTEIEKEIKMDLW